jgi:hypothetical protein
MIESYVNIDVERRQLCFTFYTKKDMSISMESLVLTSLMVKLSMYSFVLYENR